MFIHNRHPRQNTAVGITVTAGMFLGTHFSILANAQVDSAHQSIGLFQLLVQQLRRLILVPSKHRHVLQVWDMALHNRYDQRA